MSKIPVTVLIILDGFGHNPELVGNAILNTPTPNLDFLWQNFPHTLLKAAEEEVGLNFGETGNSEVGHISIGTGRVIYQSLPRINAAIQDRSFYKNPAFLEAINHVQQNQSNLHLMGMVSVAGVHAHLDHLLALLKLASEYKLPVFLHLILDGRDSGPQDASIFITKIEQAIKKYHTGTIASISGRAYTMDRNRNWERTLSAYNALVGLKGQTYSNPSQAIQENYQKNLDDESLPPTIIVNSDGHPVGPISQNDALIFTNYREDRARQITQLLTATPPAPTTPIPQNLKIVTMTKYDNRLPTSAAFLPTIPKNTLSEHLHNLGIPQVHISETEKYAHVTYFFDGGRQKPLASEQLVQVPSPKPETFQTQPQMAAYGVLKQTLNYIQNGQAPFIIINFANADMIAHTGNYEATRIAIGVIDQCVGQIYQAIQQKKGYLFLTSDHGNAESMLDPASSQPTKNHTGNPVPFIATGPNLSLTPTTARITTGTEVTGLLTDVAPTILQLLGLPIPTEMTGTPLFVK